MGSSGRVQQGGFIRAGSVGRVTAGWVIAGWVQQGGFSREGSAGRVQRGGFSRVGSAAFSLCKAAAFVVSSFCSLHQCCSFL